MNPNMSVTPGVYIEEVDAFPNSVVQVATAVPAFIGYTPQAFYEGKSYTLKPTKITSIKEFETFFAFPDSDAKQYSPSYYVTKQKKAPVAGKTYTFNGDIYTIEPDPGTIYYLYNSVQLFFQNGGSVAYIVSLGAYGQPTQSPINPGEEITNMNVKLADFQSALAALKKFDDVTMYVAPESTLLPDDQYSTLLENMLGQSSDMQTSISILDVKGGREPDQYLWPKDIENFRNATGNTGLKFGAAYYPFLKTTAMSMDQIDYTNINGGDVSTLVDILNLSATPDAPAAKIITSIKNGNKLSAIQNNQALMMASKQYVHLLKIILDKINTLPPSGIVAGIYSQVDSSTGVWAAPANVTPVGVSELTIQLDDDEQGGLNVDAESGKSINAFRFFNGQGNLLWGARTLAGNSQDWRYITVRRTVTMIEQSAKLALRNYVFAPNVSNTWSTVKSMLTNFLTNVWKEGALQGSSPDDAFSVEIGLGVTMNAQDILDGNLRVNIKIAVTHPAEFILLSVQQQLAKS